MDNIVIGIEGLVGSGKTSICRNLLEKIPNSIIFHGGNLYRGIVYAFMQKNKDDDMLSLKDTDITTIMQKLKVEIKLENNETVVYVGDKKIDEHDNELENDKPENEAVDLNKKPLQSNSIDSEEISTQNDAADFTEMTIQNEDTDFTKKSIQNEEANFNEDAIAVGDDDNKANLLNADDKVDAAGKANSNDNNSDFQKQIAVPNKYNL